MIDEVVRLRDRIPEGTEWHGFPAANVVLVLQLLIESSRITELAPKKLIPTHIWIRKQASSGRAGSSLSLNRAI
jgi:hypothetical protein